MVRENSAVLKFIMLTEKDKKLIAEAQRLTPQEWMKVYDLAEQADTTEAMIKLNRIRRTLFFKDEYEAGLS